MSDFDDLRSLTFRTRAIHVANSPDPSTGSVVRPIHTASTFVLPEAGADVEFDYSRTANPSRSAFEQTLASLENGCGSLAYASGMAAIHGAMMLLQPGDHVVTGTDIYGGLYRILHRVMNRLGVTCTLAPTNDLDAFRAAFTPNTKLAWIEPLGNPLLSVTDIAGCAAICREEGVPLGVDNTLPSPALCRPLDLGADLVMHSATKYIGGHSDVLGGTLTAKNPDLLRRIHTLQNAVGNVMGPFESYLCSRGLKTLELRMREQSRTALVLAKHLASHPRVKRVNYPGLESHPGHAIAARQMSGGFGAIISFEVDADLAAASALCKKTSLFQLAVSLGAVESLISQPAKMSHAAYDPATRRANGIADSLIRLSVGLEDAADLSADLDQALARL
jgi:cystathionine gamma-lyase